MDYFFWGDIMVKVIGKKNGKEVTVECIKRDGEWFYSFNGKDDSRLAAEIRDLLMDSHPIMGTYWPVCEALKIAAVFPYFFDRGGLEKVEVDDPEARKELSEIEYEEGVVY